MTLPYNAADGLGGFPANELCKKPSREYIVAPRPCPESGKGLVTVEYNPPQTLTDTSGERIRVISCLFDNVTIMHCMERAIHNV